MFPQSKVVVMLQTTQETNGGTITSQNLDTIGFDFVTIDVVQTTSNNTTNNPSTLKLQHSDTTDATNFSDITGAFVGDTDFTIPTVGTNTSTISSYKFNVDMRHRKRYLRLLVTPITTQSFTAVANLFRGERAPTSATDVNASVVVAG